MPRTNTETENDSSTDGEAQRCLDENREALLRFISSKLGSDANSALADIYQEISIAVLQHDFETKPIENPIAWLRKIASHKIADHWRVIQRSRKADQTWAESQPCDPQKSTADWVLDQSRRALVREVLTEIDPESRVLLREKYLVGRTVAEIAKQAKRTEKAIEHALSKARNQFRNRLQKR